MSSKCTEKCGCAFQKAKSSASIGLLEASLTTKSCHVLCTIMSPAELLVGQAFLYSGLICRPSFGQVVGQDMQGLPANEAFNPAFGTHIWKEGCKDSMCVICAHMCIRARKPEGACMRESEHVRAKANIGACVHASERTCMRAREQAGEHACLRCGAVRGCARSAVRCGAVPCGAVRSRAAQCHVVPCRAVWCGAVQCGAVRCGASGRGCVCVCVCVCVRPHAGKGKMVTTSLLMWKSGRATQHGNKRVSRDKLKMLLE